VVEVNSHLAPERAALAGDGATDERALMLTIVDNAGVTRVRSVPARRAKHVARVGAGLAPSYVVFAVDDQITSTPGFDTPSGNMRLVPDLASGVALSQPSGWIWAPADQHDEAMHVMPTCQRSTLKRLVASASTMEVSFRMAFELEFTLCHPDGRAIHEGPSHGLRALLEVEEFAASLFDALSEQGVKVEQLHPEHGAGQFELSVEAGSPIEAADRHVLLRLTIGRVARQHGLRASFAPAVFPGAVGNGCHLHFSTWRDGQNLQAGGDGPEGMSGPGMALAAGVLNHLPDFLAIYAPSVVSYERLQPGRFAGAFTCWGRENREAALRFIRGSTTDSTNIELKVVDGASNPYLVASAVVAAALDGLSNDLRLPPPLQDDPAIIEGERSHPGLRRLPADLGESIAAFERSALTRATLGDSLYEAFLAVRRLEWQTFGDVELSEALDRHRWQYG